MKRDLHLRPSNKPSKTWVHDFIHQHDAVLKEMVSQKVETKRIKACSRVAIEKFFRDVVDPMMGASI